jgi:hypothetical protein
LLDVVAIRHAVVAEDVAVVPKFLDDALVSHGSLSSSSRSSSIHLYTEQEN